MIWASHHNRVFQEGLIDPQNRHTRAGNARPAQHAPASGRDLTRCASMLRIASAAVAPVPAASPAYRPCKRYAIPAPYRLRTSAPSNVSKVAMLDRCGLPRLSARPPPTLPHGGGRFAQYRFIPSLVNQRQ
jgi:hypothetical protein